MRGLPKRRRHENKTDYGARLLMLKSGKPRLVVRKTNRYVVAQIVTSKQAQDLVVLTVSSKDLIAKGWPEAQSGSLKSKAACYLTGMLAAKLAVKAGVKEAILDMGMLRNVKKSRIFATLKGAVDGGLIVPHSKDSLPADKELGSEKTLPLVEKLKSKLN
ncbi:MAG TPA: 50S ribosomal protein L18 [Candidatus Nanoarchaeia archaeon]|nr:50S ribosomal protein L18 [Candidatus Nanoarchaeia archaeon]